MAGNDPRVNEEWNCDKGRWAFNSASLGDRFELPMVRDADGELRVASPAGGADRRRRGTACRAGPRVCSSVAGWASRTPTPTPPSPAPCCAPTTSTTVPARTPRTSVTSCCGMSRGPRRRPV
uniref:Uncharacterized protein n=1 Tax=Janibacter limosus TaxID=53458 RepID=A0AC61U5Y6_9MICO|nr:hypothetical protein [Janibacter limosus]